MLAAGALLWGIALPLGAAGDASLENPSEPNPLQRKSIHDLRSVQTGRVTFQFSSGGRWLGLIPDWAGGESVVTGGGIVVMTTDEDGNVVELVNTAVGDGETARNVRGSDPVYEGIAGGFRYPLASADDDGDGREDEEWLDGADNDDDGRIDEDYAAAGDQMIAIAFETLDEAGEPLLEFYQECYAWTLPHIDGMVAMRVVVRNASRRTLPEVRIANVIRGPDDGSVSTQDLVAPTGGRERLAAKGLLLSGPNGTAVAAVFCAAPQTEGASWLTGVTRNEQRLGDRVQAFVDAERGNDFEIPSARDDEEKRGTDPDRSNDAATGDRMAFGVSPDLGSLAPGDEVTAYFAILAVPSIDRVGRAIEDAYRTVIGDGTHRMVPPPVSVKRQTVWGTYDVVRDRADDDSSARVTITLDNARANGIGPGNISYLTGIDLARTEFEETFDGNLELTLPADFANNVADGAGRVGLRGRLRNGEYFDVVLNRAETSRRGDRVDGLNEVQYWSLPGALEKNLLTGSPNPFRESTTIYYEVPSSVSDESGGILNLINPVRTSVKVYDVTGRLIGILVDTVLSPGRYNTQWDTVNDDGGSVASGVYYVKLQIGERHVTKRLIQLK